VGFGYGTEDQKSRSDPAPPLYNGFFFAFFFLFFLKQGIFLVLFFLLVPPWRSSKTKPWRQRHLLGCDLRGAGGGAASRVATGAVLTQEVRGHGAALCARNVPVCGGGRRPLFGPWLHAGLRDSWNPRPSQPLKHRFTSRAEMFLLFTCFGDTAGLPAVGGRTKPSAPFEMRRSLPVGQPKPVP